MGWEGGLAHCCDEGVSQLGQGEPGRQRGEESHRLQNVLGGGVLCGGVQEESGGGKKSAPGGFQQLGADNFDLCPRLLFIRLFLWLGVDDEADRANEVEESTLC